MARLRGVPGAAIFTILAAALSAGVLTSGVSATHTSTWTAEAVLNEQGDSGVHGFVALQQRARGGRARTAIRIIAVGVPRGAQALILSETPTGGPCEGAGVPSSEPLHLRRQGDATARGTTIVQDAVDDLVDAGIAIVDPDEGAILACGVVTYSAGSPDGAGAPGAGVADAHVGGAAHGLVVLRDRPGDEQSNVALLLRGVPEDAEIWIVARLATNPARLCGGPPVARIFAHIEKSGIASGTTTIPDEIEHFLGMDVKVVRGSGAQIGCGRIVD